MNFGRLLVVLRSVFPTEYDDSCFQQVWPGEGEAKLRSFGLTTPALDVVHAPQKRPPCR